jgi:hypothetical protein
MDIQKFIQAFGSMILPSPPHHNELSALSFPPVNITTATKFTARFPNNLRLASGRDLNWKFVQTVIRAHAEAVDSVAFSPDGVWFVR